MSSAANSKMPVQDGSSAYRQADPMSATPQDADSGFGRGDEPHGWYASFKEGMGNVIGGFGMIPCCICIRTPFKEVQQGHAGLVTRFGRFDAEHEAGLVKVNPATEKLYQVSLKVQLLDVDRQDCMTKDNVKVTVSSVMYYKIIDAKTAIFKVENIGNALRDLVTTTLRDVAGQMRLQELVDNRKEFVEKTLATVEDRAQKWGVHIENILLKDILLDSALQASLSMAAQSKRVGEAKVITARAEVESAKLMREAADILNSAPAMQIRYLETMQAMAKSANSKVIFLPGPPGDGSAASAAFSPAVPMIAQQESLQE